MDIKELVAGLKEKGASDEEIRKTLEEIKAEIDAILEPEQEESEDDKIDDDATEEEKTKEVFGI